MHHQSLKKKAIQKHCQRRNCDIISILYELNNLDEIVKLHKIIRKLNKIQTNQILLCFKINK